MCCREISRKWIVQFRQTEEDIIDFREKKGIDIENTTLVPFGDDLSYNEWFLKRI